MDQPVGKVGNIKLTREQVKKELKECSESLNEICSKLIHLQNYSQVIMNDLNKGIFEVTYSDQEAANVTPAEDIQKP